MPSGKRHPLLKTLGIARSLETRHLNLLREARTVGELLGTVKPACGLEKICCLMVILHFHETLGACDACYRRIEAFLQEYELGNRQCRPDSSGRGSRIILFIGARDPLLTGGAGQ